jgi:hypothetical protein
MPSAAVTRIRSRIGDMGLPGVVWVVIDSSEGGLDRTGFYDRERAQAFAAASPSRTMVATPLRIRDANA